MKKAVSTLLLISLLAALAGCGTIPAPQLPASTPVPAAPPAAPASDGFETGPEDGGLRVDWSLDALRAETLAAGCMCAVAYLGYFDGDAEALLRASEAGTSWPFLADIPTDRIVGGAGAELYAIVPADASYALTVREYDALSDAAGHVFYEAPAGEPVLLVCNVSDILPNALVRVATPGEDSIEFSPMLSLRDGYLACIPYADFIYDFTPYAEPTSGAQPDICGDWCYEQYNQDGSAYYQRLGLAPDQTAYYFNHAEGESGSAYYEGSWVSEEEGLITLTLADGDGAALRGVYRPVRETDGALTLTYLSGDVLFPELASRSVTFLLSMG